MIHLGQILIPKKAYLRSQAIQANILAFFYTAAEQWNQQEHNRIMAEQLHSSWTPKEHLSNNIYWKPTKIN